MQEINKERFFVRLLLLLIVILSPTTLLSHCTIIIPNVEHDSGYIDVKIYTNEKTFLNENQAIEAIRKKATKGKTIIPLSKIHEGTIAIVVYHDEDSNNKLKTGFFWRPKECLAFSNNYQPKWPPKFSKAAINLIHGEPVIIKLNY